MVRERKRAPQVDSWGEQDVLWTVADAAHFLKLTPGSVYHLISQHRVPVIRISSRCVRLSRRALSEWVENRTQQADELSSGDARSSGLAGSTKNKK
jgi:excisionase family DNA binding protein